MSAVAEEIPAREREGLTAQEEQQLENSRRLSCFTREEGRIYQEYAESLKPRLFDFFNPPPESSPRYLVRGVPLFTAGNISGIQAQAGSGKSNFVAAMIAARICAEDANGLDTLGVTVPKGANGVTIHIDTEQARVDHDGLIRRALKRAGREGAPEWLKTYYCAGMPVSELKQALHSLLYANGIEGIHSVLIDGIGDFVKDVNDAEECNAFVAELHSLAIHYDTAIVGVMHENPGQNNEKSRGHLGSQLTRKAECMLRLALNGDVTEVYTIKARRAPVRKDDALKFQWDSLAGMHITLSAEAACKADKDFPRLYSLAHRVFGTLKTPLTYTDLKKGIMREEDIADKTAQKRLSELYKLGVIRKNRDGYYELPSTLK